MPIGASNDIFHLFNNVTTSSDPYHSTQTFNASSPFNYTGSTSFKGANGIVLYIDLGRSIILRNMRMAPRDNAAYPDFNFLTAAPGIFKIYASNDSACWTSTTHTSWTEIHSQTTSLTFNYNQYTEFGNFSTINTPYRYFAMVVYNLTGNYSYLTFSEWDIFGTYDMTPVVIDSNYKYLSFTHSGGTETQTSYTVNFPESTLCDILVVGGGGGGAYFGGGGGGGEVLFTTNLNIPAQQITINVGDGGATNRSYSVASYNGYDSSITINGITYTSLGGGGGGSYNNSTSAGTAGTNGGSGGGGSASRTTTGGSGGTSIKNTYSGWVAYGNTGGSGSFSNGGFDNHYGGGGGGAGAIGNAGVYATNTAGNGGIGVNMSEYFGSNVGASGWFGGGGGGLSYQQNYAAGIGGTGGGGAGRKSVDGYGNAISGTPGTGGGGGGSVDGSAKGGSGIVIIRYKSTKTGNQTYKVGNFNGEFKVISSVSNVDTDYIKITTAGAITNPTGTASWNTGSDRRIKENIERASYDKCYENISRLELNRFNYISGFNTVNPDKTQLGFIAQEVYEIFPKSISSQEYYSNTLNIPDLLSVDVTQINYSLYGAVKKLIEINNEKDIHILTLKNRIKILKSLLNITDDAYTSNIIVDPTTSNIVSDVSTSNIIDGA